MAKDSSGAARKTPELPGIDPKRKPGRPATGKARTVAERQEAYRQRRRADFSEWLRAVYDKGFADALAGNPPAPVETWQDPDKALVYVCGGFDGAKARTQPDKL